MKMRLFKKRIDRRKKFAKIELGKWQLGKTEGGKETVKKKNEGRHLSSSYISEQTVQCWNEMQKEFGFRDSVIEKTVQNYGSTVSLICDYCRKDFLELNEEDADAFFTYLEQRIADPDNKLSPQTVHTYKKNLNSVGEHFEAILRGRESGGGYCNPFRHKIRKTAAVKEAERENKRMQRQFRVEEKDVISLLQSVKEQENIQYYFILCMIVFCGIESCEICSMRPGQLFLEENDVPKLHIYTVEKNNLPKTKPLRDVKMTLSGSRTEADPGEVRIDHVLPEPYNTEFVRYYRENERTLQEREFLFYNRNHNPVNFKTISSVIKKHKELLKIPYPLTTKELCGSCMEKGGIV